MSDTHGSVIVPSPKMACDLIVHSGDLMPNQQTGPNDAGFQKDWCMRKREMLSRLARHARLGVLYVPGNHDWVDPEPYVYGEWTTLVDRAITIEGVRFYGLPWIPHMGGFWNYEARVPELIEKTQAAFDALPDVLVAHCPPMYCGDLAWTDFIGNPALSQRLVLGSHRIRHVLCGHNHEQAGFTGTMGGAVVINSATTIRRIEL